MNIENSVKIWLESNVAFFSKRIKRFLAMYYPDSSVRRRFWQETNVVLGDGTYINHGVIVADDYQGGEIMLEIGTNCSIAPGVVFAPISLHNNSKVLRAEGLLTPYEKRGKIIIGDDVWIGANCTIFPGVRIGRCCIIGANSLVNKDIPEYSLAYGNPVRIIKNLQIDKTQ